MFQSRSREHPLLGLSASGLLQSAVTIIACVITVDEVLIYMGIVVGWMIASICYGPVIGGALTEHAPRMK